MPFCIIWNSREGILKVAKKIFVESKDLTYKGRLTQTPEVLGAIGRKAIEAAQIATVIAPVNTGEYRDSIEASLSVNERGYSIGLVTASDWKSLWIEFGTSKGFPAYACLRRAVQAVGGKVSKRQVATK